MAFKHLAEQGPGVRLLQRSLERGRLSHAYLLSGHQLEDLELIAQTLAKTLNCRQPVRAGNGVAVDSCDACLNCTRIENANHPDVHWVRPESKLRQVKIAQLRELMREINLKPTEAEYKVSVIVAADRMNEEAANAFLKTLEEPPAKSVMVLLTTNRQRILETILSRCLRMNFEGEGTRRLAADEMEWLKGFSDLAAGGNKSLLGRYRILDGLLVRLNAMKTAIEEKLTGLSPLQRYDDADKELREKWEDELTAAIEAEYRRQRADLLLIVQQWLRDVWLHTLAAGRELLNFPEMGSTRQVAQRITPSEALENLENVERTQRLLHTNVQEALALEVGLLKLKL